MYEVGDQIEVYYGDRGRWVAGTIERSGTDWLVVRTQERLNGKPLVFAVSQQEPQLLRAHKG